MQWWRHVALLRQAGRAGADPVQENCPFCCAAAPCSPLPRTKPQPMKKDKSPGACAAKPKAKAKAKPERVDLLQRVKHPEAAGIDLAAQEAVVAVSPERAQPAVRTYSTFTTGLQELRDWLLECGIKTVAVESTGNYWIALYAILEEAGLEVWLVNAQHAKGVPGRKTDVCDAQWLQQLH